MARVAWTFTDTVTSATVSLEVNPNQADSPILEKNITYVSASGTNGAINMQEGRDTKKTMSFSGVTLTEDQYNDWVTIFNTRNTLSLEDDLGRVFEIYVTSFRPKRVRSVQYPWRHEYSVDCVVVE